MRDTCAWASSSLVFSFSERSVEIFTGENKQLSDCFLISSDVVVPRRTRWFHMEFRCFAGIFGRVRLKVRVHWRTDLFKWAVTTLLWHVRQETDTFQRGDYLVYVGYVFGSKVGTRLRTPGYSQIFAVPRRWMVKVSNEDEYSEGVPLCVCEEGLLVGAWFSYEDRVLSRFDVTGCGGRFVFIIGGCLALVYMYVFSFVGLSWWVAWLHRTFRLEM